MSSLRYTLTDKDGEITAFGTDKVQNWEDTEVNLTRSESYRGRIRKVTNSFQFVKDVRNNVIMPNYDINKVGASADFTIEVGDDNLDEFSFTPLGSGLPMKADFSSYVVKENTVELNFLDSIFQEKINSRQNEKLNLIMPTNVDGGDVTGYNTLLKDIWMHDRQIEFNTEYNPLSDYTTNPDGLTADPVFYVPVPINKKFSADDNFKTTSWIANTNINASESFYYLKSDKNRVLYQEFDIDFDLTITNLSSVVVTLFYRVLDGNGVQKSYDVIDTYTSPSSSTGTKNFKFIQNRIVEVDVDDSLQLALKFDTPALIVFKTTIKSNLDIPTLISRSDEKFDPTISKCLLPHEFFTHWIELMTGKKNAFYSDYFGRKDLGYSNDGEGAYIAIMDGHMIRNLPLDENSLNAKFKDVVEDFIKLKNLVAGVEFVGDNERFRIEKYTDVFSTDVKSDIGELFDEVELSVNNDLTYSSIKVGTKDIELENLFGLDSPHGELNYSTPLSNIDNVLDLELKAILNDYAIEQIRREQFELSPKKDMKNDKNVFFVDSAKGGTTDVLAKTNEGYSLIKGILSSNKSYNIALTPAQQIRNWADVINGCLLGEQDGQLVLTKSASNNTLETTTTSGVKIVEKDNIDISALDTPLIINENILLTSPLTKEQYDIIEDNPNDLFKFTYKGFDFYGYIKLLSYNVSKKIGNFTLNRSSR